MARFNRLSAFFDRLSDGVRRGGGNTALVALILGHHDVALVAPSGSPAVLDEPVVLASVDTIANSEDTVVELPLLVTEDAETCGAIKKHTVVFSDRLTFLDEHVGSL